MWRWLAVMVVGKSTFMNILVGVEEADAGIITRKKGLRMSHLPQKFSMDETLNVYENIMHGGPSYY